MNLEMESGDESGVGENYCGRCRESIWQRRSVLFVASGFMMNVFVCNVCNAPRFLYNFMSNWFQK